MTVPYYGTNAPTLRAQARGNTVPFVSSFLELSTFTYPFIFVKRESLNPIPIQKEKKFYFLNGNI